VYVRALRRAPQTADRIVSALLRRAAVRTASASTITGNLLLIHDPDLSVDAVLGFVAEAVRADDVRSVRSSPPEGEHMQPRERVDTAQWHCLTPEAVLAELHTARTGLVPAEARNRLQRYGPNRLRDAPTRSFASIFVGQLESLPVLLLIGSAVLSLATGGIGDALVILGVVAINAAIGTFTEYHAERTISSLTRVEIPPGRTLRDRTEILVESAELVPGDIIELRGGDILPADGRLLEAQDLTIDESSLTGESLPVAKDAATLDDPDTPLADRRNMIYRGTAVTGGSGVAVVAATGMRAEVGRIQMLATEASRPDTPMQRQLRELGQHLVGVAVVVTGGIVVIGVLRGYRLIEIMKTAVSLAVAAVPEGLPTVATTTLAAGVRRLRDRHLLVRQLHALETLGAVQVMSLDKTGTITMNRMSVEQVVVGERTLARDPDRRFEMSNGDRHLAARLERLARVAVLCSDVEISRDHGEWRIAGSSTEEALVRLALDVGVDPLDLRERYPVVSKQARTEQLAHMTTVHDTPEGGRLVAVKGRVDQLLVKCRFISADGTQRDLNETDRERIEAENTRLAGAGLRVLGLAHADSAERREDPPLEWIGLVALSDPPRPDIREVISAFKRAGVQPIMVTGDQSATAGTIARAIGLAEGRDLHVLDAGTLAGVPEPVLDRLASQVDVFSRVTPANKLTVVQALQRAGFVVAMTGDGINDGPALRAADVGIAMGKGGTEAAREVADVVVADDNLRSLIAAVAEGRTIAADIRKSVHFIVATNLSEILLMLGAAATGMGLPLTPKQLLWINVLSDVFPELALAVDPADSDVLARPPRDPAMPLVSGAEYRRLGRDAGIMMLAALVSYGLGVRRYGAGAVPNTMAFATITTAQLLYGIGARSESRSVFEDRHLPPNRFMSAAVFGGLSIEALAEVVGSLRTMLDTAQLSARDALVSWGLGGASFVAIEALKLKARPAQAAAAPADSSLRTGIVRR
jgi:P-type Ca2+ transporter type 2C